jgi:hypothetical protein
MHDLHRARLYYAAAMVVLLIVFGLAGDNGFVYVTSLLGVPIGSGVLAGLGLIRLWHAAVGCLAVVALDVVFDETRGGLGVLRCARDRHVGIAALARLTTRWLIGGRHPPTGATASSDHR